jgi:hypothetical protein
MSLSRYSLMRPRICAAAYSCSNRHLWNRISLAGSPLLDRRATGAPRVEASRSRAGAPRAQASRLRADCGRSRGEASRLREGSRLRAGRGLVDSAFSVHYLLSLLGWFAAGASQWFSAVSAVVVGAAAVVGWTTQRGDAGRSLARCAPTECAERRGRPRPPLGRRASPASARRILAGPGPAGSDSNRAAGPCLAGAGSSAGSSFIADPDRGLASPPPPAPSAGPGLADVPCCFPPSPQVEASGPPL